MMAKDRRMQSLSVFDRLLDMAPDMPADQAVSVGENMRRIKDAIRRDLETLLNTQQPIGSGGSALPEIDDSLLTFGTPGFHGLMLATKEQQYGLASSIQELIGVFEPRLKNVRVELGNDRFDNVRMLHLRIRARYHFDDGDETLVFDTVLDPAIRQFKIEAA
jgi:type VI secretion system protein ImpF